MNLKSVIRWGSDGRHAPRHCELDGCRRATRAGKPFCPRHVEQHAYVQHVMVEIAAREDEVGQVAELGARGVDVDGPTVRDILVYLQVHGDRTVPGLARELNIECAILEDFVKALERRGWVSTTTNRRGATVVSLIAGAAPAVPLPQPEVPPASAQEAA